MPNHGRCEALSQRPIPHETAQIKALAVQQEFPKDRLIFTEGDEGDTFYIIEKGGRDLLHHKVVALRPFVRSVLANSLVK